MLEGFHLQFDGFSFFLGVVAGILLSLFGYLFRGWLPHLRKAIQSALQKIKDRNFSGIDGAIRQETLKRAQHAHLAAQLFSLDEILILPKLITFPAKQDPNPTENPDFVFSRLFPHLPDWPEIPSQYPVDFISPGDSIQKGANIVITGMPGSGKTVALAHLASQFARKDQELGPRAGLLPIFLHILDLLPQTNQDLQGMLDPIDLIIQQVSARIPVWYQPQCSGLLRKSFQEGTAILLLDGLDELPAVSHKEALAIVGKLQAGLPRLSMITTASPLTVGGLLSLGFNPLSLAAWNLSERKAFAQNWGKAWHEKVMPEVLKKAALEPLDPIFGGSWINHHSLDLNPFEWTLLLWGVYAGDINQMTPDECLRAYLHRKIANPKQITAISDLAAAMINEKKASLEIAEIDALFARSKFNSIQLFEPGEAAAGPLKTSSGTKPASFEAYIQSVVKTGLLVEHSGRVYRFFHPCLLSYAAASHLEDHLSEWETDPELWDPKIQALAYGYAQKPGAITVIPGWFLEDAPLFRRYLLAYRVLKGLPVSHPVRAKLMRRLVDGLLDERNFYHVRLSFASALAISREPSVIQYFTQILASPKAELRQIGCLMLGAIQDQKSIQDLSRLFQDPVENVRLAACCALGNNPHPDVAKILEESLSLGDDILRQAAAESLAANPQWGHAILRKASQSDNLLSRRSVVFGLARISEPWAHEQLEQMAVRDSQWVVRNAAGQAVEILRNHQPLIPAPLVPPSESSWLIAFAGRQGMGIASGDPAIPLLITALSSGSTEERVAALDYLRLSPQDQVLQSVQRALANPDPAVSEAAELAIWYLTCARPDTGKVFRTAVL